ncbi:vacuolar proton ATPase [Planoprotostelium fungivorum]|uniref:V-type proton ATPase subunit a n=1 Tax=Planoprotostelium fungivorum TaxID=1890364 RepID=A0A2P6N6I6_9EUKA|nr:vacuolar proton ATPase [Planoprotostelium fungivorum]
MGELFRSEPMQLVQLYVQIEAAHDTVDQLGRLGAIQFKDLNHEVSPFQRNFVNEVKRCDEMERKLNFFGEQINKELSTIREENNSDEPTLKSLTQRVDESRPAPQMDEFETLFEETEKELAQINNNQEQLTRNYNELVELQNVLQKDAIFFSEGAGRELEPDETRSLLSEDGKSGVKLGFSTGVILRDKIHSFQRVLWRATRGNLFIKHDSIEQKIKDPHTGEEVSKDVFIIFYQGDRLQVKIKKICESFGANVYPCPTTPRERKELLSQINQRLNDLDAVLATTKKHRRSTLLNISRSYINWRDRVVKEKSIYDTMNRFNYDIGRKCLIAEGWCAKTQTEKIVNAMRKATESSGALVPSILSVIQSNEEPPTSFKTNKFTSGFQNIVDAYGVARYGEVNPGVFTITTFPFLFAVMFGDFGHGFLLLLVASFFIWKEKSLSQTNLSEMIKTVFDGRYLLLMMGAFSLYTGLIYNEFFAVPITLSGLQAYDQESCHTTGVCQKIEDYSYPFGVDPTWFGAENALSFTNSLKMKMSIVFGVVQMSLGIFLSLLNAIHWGKKLDAFCEFLPQILFLQSIFGFLVFLIFFKWLTFYPDPSLAPNILTALISMLLSPTSVEWPSHTTVPGQDNPANKFFEGQLYVQWAILFIALVSVPWMLLVKPFVLKHQHKQSLKRGDYTSVQASEEEENAHEGGHGGHGHGHGEEFEFGEIFVHQVIHTIEFVLGCVSNTASYLRLWALSLAHSQLSEVFWARLFMLTFSIATPDKPHILWAIAVFIGFAIWAGVTLGVLMVMESLSSFLHALRLHWVEFQNKFFKGDGHAFEPFSYERILAEKEAANVSD